MLKTKKNLCVLQTDTANVPLHLTADRHGLHHVIAPAVVHHLVTGTRVTDATDASVGAEVGVEADALTQTPIRDCHCHLLENDVHRTKTGVV